MFDDVKSYKRGKELASKIIEKYSPKRVMVVQNKIDKMDSDKLNSRAYKISVKSHEGIQELMEDLTSYI
jgi:GTP1/Obg family GTP-binding protein